MKIALLGYGKMGKEIEKISLSRGHEIILKVDSNTDCYNIKIADIAIDFSLPTVAFKNIKDALSSGVPVVSGTTGWLENYNDITSLCKKKKGTFLYASNFSLGVNIFFKLNEYLSKIINNFDYKIAIEETHHTQKLDEPSGTAITLADQIIKNTSKTGWSLKNANDKEIPITAKRIKDVPGTHIVKYSSKVDDIEIKHTAFSRAGFALGAVIAAEWVLDKKGIFTLKDMLNIS